MDTILSSVSPLPVAVAAPMTAAAPCHGTAVSAAAVAVMTAFGFVLPGPPRGAPV